MVELAADDPVAVAPVAVVRVVCAAVVAAEESASLLLLLPLPVVLLVEVGAAEVVVEVEATVSSLLEAATLLLVEADVVVASSAELVVVVSVLEELELLESSLPAATLKGNEYWKIVGSESSCNFSPYVVKPAMLLSGVHSYEPSLLSILAVFEVFWSAQWFPISLGAGPPHHP